MCSDQVQCLSARLTVMSGYVCRQLDIFFRKTGIFPCDRNAIPAASLIPDVFNTEEDKINTEENKNYNKAKDGLPAQSG